jgi:outer membrane protein TolC
LKIKESLASVEQTYEESLNQIETSSALLRNLLYLAEDIKVKSNAEFAYEQREVVYDEAFLKAMERRPEIRQYSAQEEANKKAIEIAKADGRPTIYASWDYYNRSHAVSSVGVNRNWNDHNVVGFTFSWPIFDGWATKAKVEQAIVDLKEAQLMKEKVIKDIALELKNSYISLKNAIVKIKAVESEVAVYQDNLAQINQKYIAGIMSSLDLDDASLKHDIAMFNKKEAIYDYIIAKASLDKAEGGK